MPTVSRSTKYSKAIVEYLEHAGHATNAEILDALRAEYPDLSATTVHRATARLAGQGRIAHAPNDAGGNLRYDANTDPHHHFSCDCCGKLHDIQLPEDTLGHMESQLGGCKLNGQLLITGQCNKCTKENKEKL